MSRTRACWVLFFALAVALASLGAGCGGEPSPTGGATPGDTLPEGAPPESASLAPADAIAYVTIVTDPGSAQWAKAEKLLNLIPGARKALNSGIENSLSKDKLSWREHIEPALGPEVVIVVTKDANVVGLTKPDDAAALRTVLQSSSSTTPVFATVDGWTAFSEKQAQLDAFLADRKRGTLESVDAFASAMKGLPADAVVRGYLNGAGLDAKLGNVLRGVELPDGLGLAGGSLGIAFQDDGVLVTGSVTSKKDGVTTRYAPELFKRVPADALVALSFGGSQKALDRLQGSLDVNKASKQFEELTGVSLDRFLDLFSGEGTLYVREATPLPEVTLVLRPPDLAAGREQLDRIATELAKGFDAKISTRTEGGLDVARIDAGDVTVSYASLDDALIVTSGPGGIRAFLGESPRLVDDPGFKRAALQVGLGELTAGFVYVDIDGLIPAIEGLAEAAGSQLPDDVRQVVETFDFVIVEASSDGKTSGFDGFVRLHAK